MARTLIHLPPTIRRGDTIDVRATIAHPMETGFRVDSNGQILPRDILTHFECRLDGAPVFAADLFPALTANPMLSFTLRAERAGMLSFTWEGDRGFRQTETLPLVIA
jgi:sulfur-oxidizing protein SoxZ